MKEYLSQLSSRERLVLAVGGMALFFLLGYVLVVEPMTSRVAQLRREVPEKSLELDWMRQAAAEVAAFGGTASSGATPGATRSPMAVIDDTARKLNLSGALKRIEPDEQNGVKVWVERAVYADILQWLSVLQAEHGIGVSVLRAEPLDAAGYVNIRMTLAGGQ